MSAEKAKPLTLLDGCLFIPVVGAIWMAGILEKNFLGSQKILSAIGETPEGHLRQDLESRSLTPTDIDELTRRVQDYANFLSPSRSSNRRILHPEYFPDQYKQVIDNLEAKVNQAVETNNFGVAFDLTDTALSTSIADGYSIYTTSQIIQLQGKVHEAVSEWVTNPEAKQYWQSRAIEDYIASHVFDDYGFLEITQNSLTVLELLENMGQPDLAHQVQFPPSDPDFKLSKALQPPTSNN